MRWLRFYARIFCSLMGALSLVSGLSLYFTLIERAAFFLLLHGAVGIARRTAPADAPHGLFPAPSGAFSAGMDLLLAALAYFPFEKVFSEALPSRQFPSAAFFFCAAVFLFLFFLFSLPNFYYLWKRSDYFSVTRRNFAGFALLRFPLALAYAFSYAVGAFLVLTLITAYIA